MKNISAFVSQLRNLKRNLQAMGSHQSEIESLKHASGVSGLAKDSSKQVGTVKSLNIKVSSSDGVQSVLAFLHTPQNYRREQTEGREKAGAILLSGASGGVVGPSSIYLSVSDKLSSLNRGIPVLRLDYRYPARNRYCVSDLLAAMDYLRNGFAISRFVLVGWSYGGAPVFTVGAQDERIVGCATIASQTAETDGISQVAMRNVPTLLMHGTADRTLSPNCSESLRDKYLRYKQDGNVQLILFDDDDHALSQNSLKAEELLCEFIMNQAGEEIGENEQSYVLQKPLLGQQEKIEKMRDGGDLRGESID